MREFSIVAGVIAVVACTGGDAASRDTAAGDSSTVAGPPATTLPPPPPPTESIASRPRTGAGGSAGTSAKPTGTKTGGGGTKTPQTKPIVTPAATPAPDSVRGIVAVVGTSFDKRVIVTAPGGGRRMEITGPLATLVGHVAGADVVVVGTPVGTSLEATRFVVRTVDGAPAIDGTLITEGQSLYIVTVKGTRTRIVSPPPPLLGHDGARVWITGDPSKGVASFGFINPPR